MTNWKLVPVEPTEEMLTASQCECGNADERDGYITHDYTSMLAATPKASEDEALVERVAMALCNAGNHGWPDEDTYNGRALIRIVKRQARAVLKMLEGS